MSRSHQRHRPLTAQQRMRFSLLLRGAREKSGLSQERAALDVEDRLMRSGLEGHAHAIHDYIRHLEDKPAVPLTSPHRLSAVLAAYGLTWYDVLSIDVLGIDSGLVLPVHVRNGVQQDARDMPPCYKA